MSQRAKQHNRPLYGSAPGTGGAGAGPGPQTGPTHLHPVQVGVSASVGHDHWANHVLNAVGAAAASGQPGPTSSTGSGAGSNSPGSSRSDSGAGPRSPRSDLHEAEAVTREHDEATIERRVLEKKRKFHTGRQLELKNLPEGCTEQDIRHALPDLGGIVSVAIETNEGRYKASARLTMEYPEVLDDWPDSRQTVFVKNKEVSVCVGNSDGWLCVAKLPLDYSDDEFVNLAGAYGKVREAFLMISEKTGESKGYGLIKYVSSDAAAQARHLLDGRTVTCPNNPHAPVYSLDCDWLNSAHITFRSLHSKALLVNSLPPNYRDMGDFRRIFSVVKTPPYCQIAMPKGVIQDWGLVEFFDPEDTEATQTALNGSLIHGHSIRIHFCIPGVNAINIYMQAVNAPPDTKKKALLNEGPTANVYNQLQKLASHNPSFVANLQNIIQDQIQTLSSGGGGGGGSSSANSAVPAVTSTSTPSVQPPVTVPTNTMKPNGGGPVSTTGYHPGGPVQATTDVTHSLLPQPQMATGAGVTAPPPPPPTHTQAAPQQVETGHTTQETGSTASPSGGNLNSNAQAALMILLSAQQDSSILQNPQVVNVLQSLVAGSGQSGQDGSRQNAKTADLMSHPVLSSVLGQTTTAAASQQQSAPGLLQQAGNDPYGKRTALLGKPPSTAHPPPPTGSYPPSSSAPTSVVPQQSNNLNNLLNTQNLSQLLGSVTSAAAASHQQQRPVLLGDRPTPGQPQAPLEQPGQAALLPLPPPPPQAAAVNPMSHSSSISGGLQHQPPPPPPSLQPGAAATAAAAAMQHPDLSAFVAAQQAALAQQQAAAAAQFNPYLLAAPGAGGYMSQPPPSATGAPPPATSVYGAPATHPSFLYGAPPIQPFGSSGSSSLNCHTAVPPPPQAQATAAIAAQAPPSIYGVPPAVSTASQLAFSMPPTSTPPSVAGGSPAAHGVIGSGLQQSHSSGGFQTPQAQKRKISIPPSPEDSPQGGYIGQHSQGIGGHYADSYWRNGRSNNGGSSGGSRDGYGKRQRY